MQMEMPESQSNMLFAMACVITITLVTFAIAVCKKSKREKAPAEVALIGSPRGQQEVHNFIWSDIYLICNFYLKIARFNNKID